jgi:hypothetical protein
MKKDTGVIKIDNNTLPQRKGHRGRLAHKRREAR